MSIQKVISKKNLLFNISSIKNIVNNKKICVMVKADAYGNGLEEVVMALRCKTDFFGVATYEEAKEVRELDSEAHILIVGALNQNKIEEIITHKISLTIQSLEELKLVEKISYKLKSRCYLHIKINSGMNRIGLSNYKQFKKMQQIIEKSLYLQFEGVFTHFATADCDKLYFQRQQKNFMVYLNMIFKSFSPLVHIGGSSCLESDILFDFDMIRVGLNVYGYKNKGQNIYVKKVMKIYSHVVAINQIKKNDRVGYSNGYITKYNAKIAVVAMGYGDGLDRRLNTLKVNIKGYNVPIIGLICMDMFIIDITKLKKNINMGDKVLVFNDADKWAKKLNTISYEILTNFSRYKR